MEKETSRPTITAFRESPDEGRGQARDMRVRWALEELGVPYRAELVTFAEMDGASFRANQPFGQIPTFRHEDISLFESGAIVVYLAQKYSGLMPAEEGPKARALTWSFAALNTLEPPIVECEAFQILEHSEGWYEKRLVLLLDRVQRRLAELSGWLGDRSWLEEEFTAADLLMTTVLRRAEGWGVLERFPNLLDYLLRAESRPAYQRAFAAQREVFLASRR